MKQTDVSIRKLRKDDSASFPFLLQAARLEQRRILKLPGKGMALIIL